MSKPVCVISGDIHYSLANLELADASTRMAIAKANDLDVPFVANGDTHDSKANLRAECVNALISTFKTANITPYVNIGNHCKINAKSLEHSLNFLRPYAHVIDTPKYVEKLKSYIIPYYDNVTELKAYLSGLKPCSRLIMHQGLMTGAFGEYIQDHSALDTADLANFRTILSHYHARQDIVCGRPRAGAVGLASYVGSPYTTTFGEANDPPKGFQILMDDGTLEFVPTNLRKHRVIELTISDIDYTRYEKAYYKPEDLLWVKVTGIKEELAEINKNRLQSNLGLAGNYRLDLIPIETAISNRHIKSDMSQAEVLDSLIDSMSNTSDERKTRLKELWRTSASN